MIPTRDDMDRWTVSRLPRLEGLARGLARCANSSVSVIFAETDDGSWRVTKMKGGKILDERTVRNLPQHINKHFDRRRSTRARTTTHPR